MNVVRKLWAAVAAVALCVMSVPFTSAQTGTAAPSEERDFPYLIPVEVWQATGGFRAGDRITITLVRGDRARIEPGGKYLVQGSYTLNSAPSATLALSLTSSANGGRSQWSESQRRRIDRGTSNFALSATMHADGEFHVSFYIPDPSDTRRTHSQGGIYFDNRNHSR
jgi:hypothetical protein